MKKFKGLFFVVLVAGIVLSLPVFAAVEVSPDFQGTLVITSPEGEITLIEAGEELPAIASGSGVQIFDGNFIVKTTDPQDNVEVSCLEHDVAVKAGASVSLSCGADTGLLKVISGPVLLTDLTGMQINLETGKEYAIKLEGGVAKAPPAAAGEELGLAAGDDLPPADSRNIQSSPAT